MTNNYTGQAACGLQINDLIPEVTFALGNRGDIATQAQTWIRDSYVELANTVPLETLEKQLNGQLNIGSTDYVYPADCRAIKSIEALIPAQNPIQPIPLVKKDIRYLNRYPVTFNGYPSIWAPFGRILKIRMPPNDSYQYTLSYWLFPTITADIVSTILQVPDDWIEVVKYGGIMRGWADLKDYTSAQAIKTLLYGDPERPDEPGLIKKKLTQRSAENEVSDYGMNPKIRTYTSR